MVVYLSLLIPTYETSRRNYCRSCGFPAGAYYDSRQLSYYIRLVIQRRAERHYLARLHKLVDFLDCRLFIFILYSVLRVRFTKNNYYNDNNIISEPADIMNHICYTSQLLNYFIILIRCTCSCLFVHCVAPYYVCRFVCASCTI